MDDAQANGTDGPTQPRPRPDRSPQDAARIRIRNRRLEYLRRNPSYVESSDREFANVTLYNNLIRKYQTPAERSAEAQDKGFGQVLEASMLRNPEPLQQIDDDDMVEEEEEEEEDGAEKKDAKDRTEDGENGEDDDLDMDGEGSPQGVARQRWHRYVREWFVRGAAADDDGFDYAAVDDESDYDTLARADEEDAWFDDEAPAWASDGEGDGEGGEGEKRGKPAERMLTGQTGIQDF